MAKVPKRVIREAQLRANETLQWYNKPSRVWASTMADLRLKYNRAKAGAYEYGFVNQSSHSAGTQAAPNH